MAEISIVYVEINGVDISDDIAKVYEGKLTRRKPVNLMHRTGSIRTRLRPTVGFDHVVKEGAGVPFFEDIENGTIVIIYEDGTRIQFLGSSHTDTGDVTYNEDNEAVKRYDFTANERQVA